MRLFVASVGLASFAIIAACGGSDGGGITPPEDSDSGAITTEAGASEAGPSDAQAGADAADGGDNGAIVAPNDTWTWVDFPTSKCGSGTPTGIGVNPHAGATELVIYLEGGGSCTTGATCWGPTPGATFMSGFGAADFPKQKTLNLPILNRSLMANPVAKDSYVYVPYCTGDLHGGHTETDLDLNGMTKPTYFWGGADMDLFLARLVPTFPNLTRVVLTGTSAGGFGSFIAFDKTVRAFNVRVDVIDDSGPPIPPALGDGTAATGVWKIDKPVGCASCATLRDIYDADRAQQPNSRFGLLTYNRDSTIAPDFGYTVDQYPALIDTFTSSISADPRAHVYEVNLTAPAAEHVVQAQLALAVGYLPWMTKLLNDDPTWANEMATPP